MLDMFVTLFYSRCAQMDPLVPFIKAVVIMDGDGKRLSCKVSCTSHQHMVLP